MCLLLFIGLLQTAWAQDDFPFVSETKGDIQIGLYSAGINGVFSPIRSTDGDRFFSITSGIQGGYYLRNQLLLQGGFTYTYQNFIETLRAVSAEVNLRYIYPVWRLHLFGQAGISAGQLLTRNLPGAGVSLPTRGGSADMRLGVVFHINKRWALESSYGASLSLYNDIDGLAFRNIGSRAVRLGVNYRI